MAAQLKPMTREEFVMKILAGERDFSRIALPEGTDLSGYEGFSEMQDYLRHQQLQLSEHPIILDGSELRHITARGLYLPYFRGRDADLCGADLQGAPSIGCFEYAIGTHLEGAKNCKGAYLRGADLMNAKLVGAYLAGADLEGADLRRADLRETHLVGAYLIRADLNKAILEGADLRGACLGGAYLRETVFDGANLGGADLRGANLWRAHLVGADLSKAVLDGAILEQADLRGANLWRADLLRVDLRGANFIGSKYLQSSINLEYAIFDRVKVTPAEEQIIREALAKRVNLFFIVDK